MLRASVLFLALVCGSASAGVAEWTYHMEAGAAAERRADLLKAVEHYSAALKEAEVIERDGARVAHSAAMLANAYQVTGRFNDAFPLIERSMSISEKTMGPEHPGIVPTLNLAGSVYAQMGRFADAERLLKRAIAIVERQLGAAHLTVSDSLGRLALLYQGIGRPSDAEAVWRRSLDIREKVLGPLHPGVAQDLNSLALLYSGQARYAEAVAAVERALMITEKAFGAAHPNVAIVLQTSADIQVAQSRFAQAETMLQRSLAIRERVFGNDHVNVAMSTESLGVFYRSQGRLGEAEQMLRRALVIRERALGSDSPTVASTLNLLSLLYTEQHRYSEAELLVRRGLAVLEKAGPPESAPMAALLSNLAELYRTQGRLAEARPLQERALAMKEKLLPANHPDIAASVNNLAMTYFDEKKHAEAERRYRQALSMLERTYGPEHLHVAVSLKNIAVSVFYQARYGEAEALLLRSLALFRKVLGEGHVDVANTLTWLALLQRHTNRQSDALENARRSTTILATRYGQGESPNARSLTGEQRGRAWAFEQHVSLLYSPPDKAKAEMNAKEAFAVSQGARGSETASQVARMAARFAVSNDVLAKLVRERQDAVARSEKIDDELLRRATVAAKERDSKTEARLTEERATVVERIRLLHARLTQEFPQYTELVSPGALALEEAQRLLANGEAMVAFLIAPEEAFVWVVTRSEARFSRIAVSRAELEALVKRLRLRLDLGAANQREVYGQPFDAEAAHELYRLIFAPIESVLAGVTHLIVVPDGPLQSLPFSVLVKTPVTGPLPTLVQLASLRATRNLKLEVGPEILPNQVVSASAVGYADVDWLIKRYAITVLPAVGSLRALRAFARTAAGTVPFVGFGDPILGGSAQSSRGAKLSALLSRGPVADAREVRLTFDRLPETADELRAIAATLKAGTGDLFLGSAATETRVKKLDLANYRNIAFATHGLMAGEMKGVMEPALVLTPPDLGTELDDGLLTASEIAQLKLNADWIILSACNTAASDGTPGADGLSGLAKAFFYAGARSLLVSHWAVSSDASVAITTRLFEESAKGASKAEALRRSAVALMNRRDNPYFAHPAFWAPFIVVGEGTQH